MALVSLIYVSYASQSMSDDELKPILEVSRRNNTANGITGMLLYRDGFFIQVLEGEKEMVDSTFRKIAVDPRHGNVLEICENEITERTFSHWQMGFNHIQEYQLKQMEGYTDYLESPADFMRAKPDRALMLLEAFRDRTFF